ncbi:MAG: FKBP-type peptidyl-prolyl cis-trans isomerase [Ideonella sp.]|nr:FKBP-type peptidyl-prolyl cis-trans isomerase [Ideonella sp.]MCC7455619.1 FKBP-type peptidyl-prolyl cis-trans isomerase [Nitrospira sp.]
MKPVDNASFLTLHYRLAGPDGADVVNTFGATPATLSLGEGQLAPAMESLLLGLTAGHRETFRLAPGAAFGARNPELVQRVGRTLLAQLQPAESGDTSFAVGDVVRFPRPDGEPGFAGVVREVADDWLLFDFNHPLAGEAVTFEVELIEVL